MFSTTTIKNIALTVIVLISVSFYHLFIIDISLAAMAATLASAAIIFLLLIHIIYFKDDSGKKIKKTFTTPVFFIILSPFLSMIVAKFYHGQPIWLSIYAQSAMYFYFLYFLLHRWKINPYFILKLIIILGFAYIAIYFIQRLIYPIRITTSRIWITRGTTRIFLPGSIYAFYTYFFLLSKTVSQKMAIKNVILILIFFSVLAILQGTRGSLLYMVAFTGLYFLLAREIKNRYIILFLSMVVAICIFFAFIEVFQALIEHSKEEQAEGDNYPRVRAVKYFLGDFMPSPIAYILGNGAEHYASPYGQKIMYIKSNYGMYQSDIGMVGTYSKYGVFLVIGYLTLIIRIVFFKLPPQINVLRFFYIGELIAIVYGGGGYTRPIGAVSICLILYLIDTLPYYEDDNTSNNLKKLELIKS